MRVVTVQKTEDIPLRIYLSQRRDTNNRKFQVKF